MSALRSPFFHIDVVPVFKAGDPAPEGYLEWHEWADVQHKAGLRQKQCGCCMLWCYPQELSGEVIESQAKTTRGQKVKWSSPICLKCQEKRQ